MLLLIALLLQAMPLSPLPHPREITAQERAIISESVGRQLADPFSAQYDWQPVRDEMLYCGWVNAKNSFGAYTGYQPFLVQYYIGNQSRRFTISGRPTLTPAVVARFCLEAGYLLSR